jgi:hypothetical protein
MSGERSPYYDMTPTFWLWEMSPDLSKPATVTSWPLPIDSQQSQGERPMSILERAKLTGQVIKTRQGFVPKWIHEESGRLWYYTIEHDDVETVDTDGRKFTPGDDPADLVLTPKTGRVWYKTDAGKIIFATHSEPPSTAGWHFADVEIA